MTRHYTTDSYTYHFNVTGIDYTLIIRPQELEYVATLQSNGVSTQPITVLNAITDVLVEFIGLLPDFKSITFTTDDERKRAFFAIIGDKVQLALPQYDAKVILTGSEIKYYNKRYL